MQRIWFFHVLQGKFPKCPKGVPFLGLMVEFWRRPTGYFRKKASIQEIFITTCYRGDQERFSKFLSRFSSPSRSCSNLVILNNMSKVFMEIPIKNRNQIFNFAFVNEHLRILKGTQRCIIVQHSNLIYSIISFTNWLSMHEISQSERLFKIPARLYLCRAFLWSNLFVTFKKNIE